MDAIPVISQAKSFIQWIFQDDEGALQTQINFSRQCPVVSQVRSAVEAATGDCEAARETQREFGGLVEGVVNGIPVVGHVKGAVHYALKDKEGGDAAMKAASHTTAVVGGGVGGFLVGGPVGAVAGGIGAGVAIDATISGADSAINGEFTPYGALQPIADPTDAGKWCDAIGGVALDGLTGRFAGNITQAIKTKTVPKPAVITETVLNNTFALKAFRMLSAIKLILKKYRNKIFIKILENSGSDTTNAFVKLIVSDANEKKADVKKTMSSPKGEHVKIHFEHNGNELKFYFEGELIFVRKGHKVSVVDGKEGMKVIEDGPEYCVCPNGTFVAKPEPEVETNGAQVAVSTPVVSSHEDWFLPRNDLVSRTSVSFMYDSEERIIVRSFRHQRARPSEDSQIQLPVQERVVQDIPLA